MALKKVTTNSLIWIIPKILLFQKLNPNISQKSLITVIICGYRETNKAAINDLLDRARNCTMDSHYSDSKLNDSIYHSD